MKIGEAKKIYSAQLNSLWSRKRELTNALKEQEESGLGGQNNFDRVELSRELSQVDAEYEQMHSFMEKLQIRETAIHNAEVSKQQCEAYAKAADDMAKCMEIARRISSGAKVPSKDERKLMEYSSELYMAAKNMAFLNAQAKRKEYDSLWKDEEEQGETASARDIADNADVNIPLPETVVVQAAETPSDD